MQEIFLRPATTADANRLRHWRDDPAVRAASRNTSPLDDQEHLNWLCEVLADSDQHLFVAEHHEMPIGQVRLEHREQRWEINVGLAAEARGRGLGTAVIRAAVGWLWRTTDAGEVEAVVRRGNVQSLGAFYAAGFEERRPGDEAEFLRLVASRQRLSSSPDSRGGVDHH